MFERLLSKKVSGKLEQYPAVAVTGPRQVGKTTLVKEFASASERKFLYLDLESENDLNKLSNAESYFKERSDYLIILDEVQRQPQLFPLLRSVIDIDRKPGRFLLTGSASPELLTVSSESLAGRISYLELTPLQFEEVKWVYHPKDIWLKGGFPGSLLAVSSTESFKWRQDFIRTYIERELPLLGMGGLSPITMRRLLRMLAHLHGQILNYSELSRSLGISLPTIKKYLDYLEYAYLIRRVEPYFANIGKRLIRSPRLYIRDTGLLHAIIGLTDMEELESYPGKGASWESWVLEQIIPSLRSGIDWNFYRTQDGSELDLVLSRGIKPVLGIEIKYASAPKISKGTAIAAEDLGNIPVWVVTPEINESYFLQEGIEVIDVRMLSQRLNDFGLT